ncbi:MAG: transcription antitermination factor NusB [Candidatus Tectomicrobia bacterium]|nr:transcription antitermination factor NusB [Candidatus Tectomicrobia bacterium]
MRRQVRTQLMQLLYAREFQEVNEQATAACFWPETPLERQEYVQGLYERMLERLGEIDALLEEASEHWKVSRMPLVDRNILRVAIFELLEQKEVPGKVVIDEAIEIGKLFGAEESSAFINGILDTMYRAVQLQPCEKASTA